MDILEVFFWYCKHMGIMAHIYEIYQNKKFGYWKYDYYYGTSFERCNLKDFLIREHRDRSLKDIFWPIQRYTNECFAKNSEKYKKARARWNAFVENNLMYDPKFIKEGDEVILYDVTHKVVEIRNDGLIKIKRLDSNFCNVISPFQNGLRFENNEIREPKFLIKKNRKIYGTNKE